MYEAWSCTPEIPSPHQMVGSLRGLLRRRNHLLQADQPTRRHYELGDFDGSESEREQYSHVFALAVLLEDHCLADSTRPSLVDITVVNSLEAISWDTVMSYRNAISKTGESPEAFCARLVPGQATDRRSVLADQLVFGLIEQRSSADFVAIEARAAIHFQFDTFDLHGQDPA